MADNTTPFEAAWWAFDLPGRPCDGTYCRHEYDALPPLDDSLFQGVFQWLTDLDDSVEAVMAVHRAPDFYREKIARQLASLRASADEAGVTLPPEFISFMENPDWQYAIPSCTACEFDLSTRVVPAVVEPGAFFVRFLNDQQDVLLWYLYLSPQGEASVVCSPIPFDDPNVNEPADVVKAYTVFSAPSFEVFLYRFWLENTIWFAGEGPSRSLTTAEQAYVDHYKQG